PGFLAGFHVRDRQRDVERRSGFGVALGPESSVMPRHDLAADIEAESETADVIGARVGGAVEEPEDLLDLARGDADALVAHRDDRVRAGRVERHHYATGLRRVLDRVADEVLEDLLAAVAVRDDGRGSLDLRLDLVALAEQPHPFRDL